MGDMRWCLAYFPTGARDEFMAELHEELGQPLTRTGCHGMRGAAWSLSRGRRHFHAHSSSQAQSPWVESRRKEVAKWPQGP